ncbi:hypothetical protein DFH29DRAFT_880853 [Suillus ampliporus]|nr:hypothetical protein DFH29DRAFT_880853 [Suillus ampliporus]
MQVSAKARLVPEFKLLSSQTSHKKNEDWGEWGRDTWKSWLVVSLKYVVAWERAIDWSYNRVDSWDDHQEIAEIPTRQCSGLTLSSFIFGYLLLSGTYFLVIVLEDLTMQ